MKRFVFIMSLVFGIVSINAQTISEKDQLILDKIKQQNENYTTISSDFLQTKHMPFLDEDISSGGKFYYSKPDKLSMWYNEPAGDLMLINQDKFVMIASGRRNETTSKNATMKSMKLILSACIEGDIQKAGTTSVSCTETPQYYIVSAELITGKSNKSNISKVRVNYDKKDCSVSILQNEEPDGTYNVYELTNKKLNQNIEEEFFTSKK